MPYNFLVINCKCNRSLRYIRIEKKNWFKNTFSISFCASRGCCILSTYIYYISFYVFFVGNLLSLSERSTKRDWMMVVEYISLSFLCEYYNVLQALTKKNQKQKLFSVPKIQQQQYNQRLIVFKTFETSYNRSFPGLCV